MLLEKVIQEILFSILVARLSHSVVGHDVIVRMIFLPFLFFPFLGYSGFFLFLWRLSAYDQVRRRHI
jgi:hypothetical protein